MHMNMSPNLVYFKAHLRGFDGGLKIGTRGARREVFLIGEGEEKRRLECKA